jgi:hypothetical protein
MANKPQEYVTNSQYLVENEDDVKFSKVFCSAAESQTNIKSYMKDLIKTEIKDDKEIKEVIKQSILEVESESWKSQLKSWGNKIERLIWLIVGSGLTLLVKLI